MISPDRLLPNKQIYNFLRTVTIKYSPIAMYLNETLAKNGYSVNYNDQTTWKYYLNLQGKYHVSDQQMFVTSLDTRAQILFSPDVLALHPRTKAAYVPGGAYYQRLCDFYPEQVDLIKSILFPVTDVTKAILADDLTLLNYGSGYLEVYEESVFIMQIEDFLSILKERWYFDFLDDEPYFYLTFWSSVPIYLAMLLMSGRIEHINTPYVHSSDIWDKLAANGVSNYSDVLDRKKQMMLYQNIGYFKANAGKQSNLTILSHRLLDDLGIGVYGRMVVQEAETGAAQYQLTPQLVPFVLPGISKALPAEIEIKRVSVVQTEIYDKGLTSSDAAETIAAVERKLGDTTLNEFVTKFIEIRPLAQNKPYAELLNGFLMDTLVTSITAGYYSVPVEVVDPLTREIIYLSPLELLALYGYAVNQSMGITLTDFPTQVNVYRSFNTVIGTPSKTLIYDNAIFYLSEVVDSAAYLSGLTYDQSISSPTDFSNNTTALWMRYIAHIMMDQNTLIDKAHFAYQYLSSLCHSRRQITVNFVTGYDNYTDWLGSGGIDIASSILSQYAIQSDPQAQWANLADAIITALIPINDTFVQFGNFTLSDSGYARLSELFVQLLSYRTVVLESDRSIADYAPGAKWSTDYGPVLTDTFGEQITAIASHTTDYTTTNQDKDILPGIQIDPVIEMTASATYTVTYTTDMGASVISQNSEQVHGVMSPSSSMMVSGPITIGYSPAIPNLVP